MSDWTWKMMLFGGIWLVNSKKHVCLLKLIRECNSPSWACNRPKIGGNTCASVVQWPADHQRNVYGKHRSEICSCSLQPIKWQSHFPSLKEENCVRAEHLLLINIYYLWSISYFQVFSPGLEIFQPIRELFLNMCIVNWLNVQHGSQWSGTIMARKLQRTK